MIDKKTGQKLYRKAKTLIPGGTMLLSKRPEMFLPNAWPSYFNKSKGCEVWDLDNNKYVDLVMGIGPNSLGYGNKKIDDAVLEAIKKGNMSTFSCPEEVELAEKLIELHPWANMVRFARTGGEANAIAIRIARAASQKDNVAVCGYHGWHDWYLSANLAEDDQLAGHLLPGLSTAGVPKSLKGNVHPFNYNDFDHLVNLVSHKEIGVIKMEVIRNLEPQDYFLKRVRKLASDNNIVLIFDECTSGFRKNFGGLHLHFKVNPDIAIFGKALGNGYAITSIIGKRNIMETAQKSFISSTFWTERIGPAAAIETLNQMKKLKSWKTIDSNGKYIIKKWKYLAKKYDLQLEVKGLPALCSFLFKSKNNDKYKALITQELLKKGFLASNTVYSSIAHKRYIVDKYLEELEKVFLKIQNCENGQNINKYLNFGTPQKKFERMN